jgi:hypothetical protein
MKILMTSLMVLFSLSSFASQASEKSDANTSLNQRKLASDRDGDVNTPYTPAYLEKIDSNDRESDPEFVEESKADRSKPARN